MIIELTSKILLLKTKLKERNNLSFSFFDKLLDEINGGLLDKAIDTILKSYSIVQYADFNYQEEELFEEIWNIAQKIRG